jgi:hypothetical protein
LAGAAAASTDPAAKSDKSNFFMMNSLVFDRRVGTANSSRFMAEF